MAPPTYPEIWQCVGMIVGVYGIGYAIASADPLRHWPIILVGFLGKIFGPLGFAQALYLERLPLRFGPAHSPHKRPPLVAPLRPDPLACLEIPLEPRIIRTPNKTGSVSEVVTLASSKNQLVSFLFFNRMPHLQLPWQGTPPYRPNTSFIVPLGLPNRYARNPLKRSPIKLPREASPQFLLTPSRHEHLEPTLPLLRFLWNPHSRRHPFVPVHSLSPPPAPPPPPIAPLPSPRNLLSQSSPLLQQYQRLRSTSPPSSRRSEPSTSSLTMTLTPSPPPPRATPNVWRPSWPAAKLTPYQAGAILQGKARGLRIDDYLILDRAAAAWASSSRPAIAAPPARRHEDPPPRLRPRPRRRPPLPPRIRPRRTH